MSLEDALKENTAALRELTEAIVRGALPEAQAGAKQRTLGEVIGAKKDAPATTAAATKPAATTKPATAAKPAAATKPAAKAAETDEYAPVQKAIEAAVAAGHRNSVKNILAEYDAKNGKDLDPSAYPEVLEKLTVIMGGEVDDLS